MPVPGRRRASEWYNAFADDHYADFLLRGVTQGFSYEYTYLDPGGPYNSVPNYVPDEHAHKVDAWVQTKAAMGRYNRRLGLCERRSGSWSGR